MARQILIPRVVNPSFIRSKVAAMAIYEYVGGERLPRDAKKAKDIAIRMAELVLSTRDFDIIQDLRELNGRPESPLFDLFWSEVYKLLESNVRVDDRRHGDRTL